MTDASPLQNISDTALWVAHLRAQESARPDAHFRDPFAAQLAGERGPRIADLLSAGQSGGWALVARTVAIDAMVHEAITREGVDTVLCLAAGLDVRPYRLALPPTLRWIEVDLPGILAYKAERLGNAKPRCALETVALDLRDYRARQDLFRRVARESQRVLVITEGLLVYLTEALVGELAEDLHRAGPGLQTWIADLHSPDVLRRLQRQWDRVLQQADAPMRFAPAEGPGFFKRFGWTRAEVRGLAPMTRTLRRGPHSMRWMTALISRLPPARREPWDLAYAAVRFVRA